MDKTCMDGNRRHMQVQIDKTYLQRTRHVCKTYMQIGNISRYKQTIPTYKWPRRVCKTYMQIGDICRYKQTIPRYKWPRHVYNHTRHRYMQMDDYFKEMIRLTYLIRDLNGPGLRPPGLQVVAIYLIQKLARPGPLNVNAESYKTLF